MQAPRGKHTAHREKKDGEGQNESDPELAGKTADLVGLMIVTLIHRHLGFQGHPADRAIPGLILLDLRVHRTSVNGALRWSPSGVALEGHAALRAITRNIGFDAGAHGAEKLRCPGWRDRPSVRMVTVIVGLFVIVSGAPVRAAGRPNRVGRRDLIGCSAGLELGPAVFAAEIVSLFPVLET